MAELPANLKAFLAAAVFVTVLSLVLVQTGIIGGDDDEGTLASGATPAVLGVIEGPFVSTPTPAPPPGPGVPLTVPVQVPILMYHRVLPELPDGENPERLTVTTADLEEQLAYLACAGFTPVTVQRLFEAFEGTYALPERPIILTFDDGWADHYTYVFPMLRAHGFAASFAIPTGLLEENEGYMTWGQVRAMSEAGMEMLSHTVSHYDLNTPDDEATALDEVARSKGELEERLGRPAPFFVYPSGEPFRSGTEERQAEVVEMLRGAGYRGALLANEGYVMQDPGAPFQLHRLRVEGGLPLETFAGAIYGPPCGG